MKDLASLLGQDVRSRFSDAALGRRAITFASEDASDDPLNLATCHQCGHAPSLRPSNWFRLRAAFDVIECLLQIEIEVPVSVGRDRQRHALRIKELLK